MCDEARRARAHGGYLSRRARARARRARARGQRPPADPTSHRITASPRAHVPLRIGRLGREPRYLALIPLPTSLRRHRSATSAGRRRRRRRAVDHSRSHPRLSPWIDLASSISLAPPPCQVTLACLYTLLKGDHCDEETLYTTAPQLLPVLKTNLDDYDASTRQLVCLSLHMIFKMLPNALGEDALREVRARAAAGGGGHISACRGAAAAFADVTRLDRSLLLLPRAPESAPAPPLSVMRVAGARLGSSGFPARRTRGTHAPGRRRAADAVLLVCWSVRRDRPTAAALPGAAQAAGRLERRRAEGGVHDVRHVSAHVAAEELRRDDPRLLGRAAARPPRRPGPGDPAGRWHVLFLYACRVGGAMLAVGSR